MIHRAEKFYIKKNSKTRNNVYQIHNPELFHEFNEILNDAILYTEDTLFLLNKLKNSGFENINSRNSIIIHRHLRSSTLAFDSIRYLFDIIRCINRPDKYIYLTREMDPETYLTRPFKVKDVMHPKFPIAIIKKVTWETFVVISEYLNSLGHEVEIIRGYVPAIKLPGIKSYTGRLWLPRHGSGNAIDFKIVNKTAKESFDIIKAFIGNDTPCPTFFVLLKDSIHLHLKRPNCKGNTFYDASGHAAHYCATVNPNRFLLKA